MPSDRVSRFRRRVAPVEAEPSVVADEMEAATQRLRDQAWKMNAVTRAPLISETELREISLETVDP